MRALAVVGLFAAVVAPPSGAQTGTCRIDVLAVDDEFVPVAGAQVGVLNTDPMIVNTTGADGFASLHDVPNGTRQVAGSKAGFEPDVKNVNCVAGGVASVTLSLIPVPPPPEPFVVIHSPLHGKIGCSVGFLFVSTADVCKEFGLSPDAQARFGIAPPLDPINAVVYEVEWTPSTPVEGECLELTFPAFKAHAPQIAVGPNNQLKLGSRVVGTSPIRLVGESPLSDPLYDFTSPNAQMVFAMRAPGSALNDVLLNPTGPCSMSAAYEQPFTLHVALFANGALIPPGFTMLGP